MILLLTYRNFTDYIFNEANILISKLNKKIKIGCVLNNYDKFESTYNVTNDF